MMRTRVIEIPSFQKIHDTTNLQATIKLHIGIAQRNI